VPFGRYLRWPRVEPRGLTGKLTTVVSRPVEAACETVAKSTPNHARHWSAKRFSASMTELSPWFLLSCKANDKVKCKDGTLSRPLPLLGQSGFCTVPNYNRPVSACEYAILGSNPRELSSQSTRLANIKDYVLLGLWFSLRLSCGLQPWLDTLSESEIPSYSVRCLLLSPAMRWKAGIAKNNQERRLALRTNLRSITVH
jgi:hypothetical protein